jgi:DNA-binding PadR family transcriptional regulator
MGAKMKNGKTRYVILGLLTEGPMTGYDIKKIIDIRFSFFWNESYGQLYPMLKALAEENLITADKNSEGRGKVTYAITNEGRKALKEWLHEPVEKEIVRFELLLKMYFSAETSADVMKSHVQAFMDIHLKQLAMLDMFEKELRPIADQDNHKDVLRVIDFGQKVYRAYTEWGEETIKYLERGKKDEA